MVTLPRLVVAAPASGHGKTTVATGLMAALARAGHIVSGHKVGPDYIDPGYHALATGRPGRNLDPHLVGEDRLVPLLLHGARGADLAVIEGVMGLFDGQLGTDGFSSTAHVARVTGSPVVLVVDVSHASRSIAATVHGMATWDPAVRIAGIVLNKAGSDRHAAEVLRALGDRYPVLGVLRRDDGIEAPSRHLGLVPAAERPEAGAALDRLAAQVAERIDLAALIRIARSADDLAGTAWSPTSALTDTEPVAPGSRRPVIAVAGGRAFTFRYAETTELLEAAGCEVVILDPTRDEVLPEGTSGLYLGGGFPEMHAADLSGNRRLREQIRTAVTTGLPTVAECAGLLYLCREVDGVPMAGVLAPGAAMAPRLTLAYRTAHAGGDNLLTRRGETVTGHEFHRTALEADLTPAAWTFAAGARTLTDGIATPTLHAGYLHTHWAGHPHLAARFAAAARTHPGTYSGMHMLRPGGEPTPTAPAATSACPRAPEPALLRHHGDREATAGLVDFAVNVFDGARPEWLEEALRGADVGRYPDAGPAADAVAARHGLGPGQVLPTAGAAEAFGLLARLRDWRHPVVVHPQFTEPDVALRTAGHRPEHVLLTAAEGFALDPGRVPEAADLVVIGNPTNPTGVRHPANTLRALLRPGRLVVVDEAFCDDDRESLAAESGDGLVVVRSLTKLWSIPGVRAGYLLGDPDTLGALADLQTPWSVSAAAVAALVACSSEEARREATERVARIAANRQHLLTELRALGLDVLESAAPFVLARPGAGVHRALREAGVAVRRADTFPGLDESWVRIAVRDAAVTEHLLDALRCVYQARGSRWESGTVALL